MRPRPTYPSDRGGGVGPPSHRGALLFRMFHNSGTGLPDLEGWTPGCTHLHVLVLLNTRPGSERCVQCVLTACGRLSYENSLPLSAYLQFFKLKSKSLSL